MIPGEFVLGDDDIIANGGAEPIEVNVTNTGDRPVQVGSHHHFAEINAALQFDRGAAYGYRLNIPAGTAVRFEPGDPRTVALTPLGGRRCVHGLRNAVDGPLDASAPFSEID